MDKTMTPDQSQINFALIRNYHFIRTKDGEVKVQFVAIGDKHRMMKRDDGSVAMIKEAERGKPYRYGTPYNINDALNILDQAHFRTHPDIAAHIRENTPS